MRAAVCYAASGAGYMFPTLVSAAQARAHTRADVDVIVLHLVGPSTTAEERTAFAQAAEAEGVIIIHAPITLLQGLRPIYARFCLVDVLSGSVDHILYLDGDTQVLGDLSPLIDAEPPKSGALAALDPMVFTREVKPALGRRIDAWWDESGIPAASRVRYVNTGVIRIELATLRTLRDHVQAQDPDRLNTLHFLDQDVINVFLGDKVGLLPMAWNFPGFLLGTALEELLQPRIIHFMSDPRPWNARLPPWGETYHRPYLTFASRYPAAAKYRTAFDGMRSVRYAAQQLMKHVTERPLWDSPRTAGLVRELERGTMNVTGSGS